jgi:hypothetical protein
VIRNCAGVKLCRRALGADNRTLTLRATEEHKTYAPGWPCDGAEFAVEQISIDSLGLGTCHLIKVDVDGQELEILQGAEETIARCRPIIYVENDKPEEYPDLMPWLDRHGYRMYQHYAPLFNPHNFRSNPVNVFGGIVSAMILAVPTERKDLRADTLGGKVDRLRWRTAVTG